MASDLTVADIILAQLGGRRFLAMTGAKSLCGGDRMLSFRLPTDPHFVKGGISAVKITLTPADDYTLEFLALRKDPRAGFKLPKVVAKADGVQVDNLRAVFTEHTGLDCTLGGR